MRNLFRLLLVGLAGLLAFNACSMKLDEQKCTELILSHPFFDCRHIGVSKNELPDCAEHFAGSVPKAYFDLRDKSFTTAYYYYLYGFGVTNVHDLQIEGTQAVCKFDLVKVNETSACQRIKDDRLSGDSMPCQALFIKYEDGGWKLAQIVPSKRLFTINIWGPDGYQAFVNFNSFKL